ncbi:Phage-related lysozyme (muraminidase) [Candidatus Bartonella washoeensis]|nr:Phage-related lysozyme (muraminidase) [Bartonella washoeensis]
MRKISKEGLALIKQLEGLRLSAYEDAIGVWTIGYGHTSAAGAPDVYEGMQITEKEAEKILRQDLRQLKMLLNKLLMFL